MSSAKLTPKKSLGQHFLNSPSALAKIVEAADISKDETILEIGPGTGILTAALLESGAKVIAVEKDARAKDILEARFVTALAERKLTVHQADILETDRSAFGLTDGGYAVVANIPYYITGAILESFLEYAPRPNRMILLVQKEVADRIAATDGKESLLSISVKAFGDPKTIAKVPRGAFSPPPSVDSAIISIANISNSKFAEKGLEIRRFFEIVKAGFAHKRKFVRRNLEEAIDAAILDTIWREQNLDDKIRAEDMTLEQWLSIAASARV